MSLSKECQEYHLTPRGWITGTFTRDTLGGIEEKPIPEDRVLIIVCYDELPAVYSKPYYHYKVIWKSDDKELVERLKSKWGEKPKWFGFNEI